MKSRILSPAFFWIIVIILAADPLFAQTSREITGTVYDSSSNTSLPDVSVLVKGTPRGVSTDANGRFKIQAAPTDKLVFSTIGFKDRELALGNQSVINVVMSGNAEILQNIIVNTGYGTQKRTDVTGAVASISSKEITELPLTNFQQALQGRAPGIDVVSNGTAPGSGVTVRIRGRRSFSAGNDPLYVLDGIPMTGDMTDINPNDIESMDVLKDASATAIYGSRGANGVVLITTKKGKTGKPVLSYSMYTGVTTPEGKYNVMNGEEYKKYRVEAFRTIGQEAPWAPVELESMAIGRSTNWQDMILENGFQQQHDLNISGGTENTKYSVSGGFFNEEGVIPLQDFRRYNLKISLTQECGKKIEIWIFKLCIVK